MFAVLDSTPIFEHLQAIKFCVHISFHVKLNVCCQGKYNSLRWSQGAGMDRTEDWANGGWTRTMVVPPPQLAFLLQAYINE